MTAARPQRRSGPPLRGFAARKKPEVAGRPTKLGATDGKWRSREECPAPPGASLDDLKRRQWRHRAGQVFVNELLQAAKPPQEFEAGLSFSRIGRLIYGLRNRGH